MALQTTSGRACQQLRCFPQNQEAANEMLSAHGSRPWSCPELPAEFWMCEGAPCPLLLQHLVGQGPGQAAASPVQSDRNPPNGKARCPHCAAGGRVKEPPQARWPAKLQVLP